MINREIEVDDVSFQSSSEGTATREIDGIHLDGSYSVDRIKNIMDTEDKTLSSRDLVQNQEVESSLSSMYVPRECRGLLNADDFQAYQASFKIQQLNIKSDQELRKSKQ